jgi:hypothetical protein
MEMKSLKSFFFLIIKSDQQEALYKLRKKAFEGGLVMHSWIRRKLKFVLFYNYKFTKMNKQERVTFVINTLKEFYPSIPVPLDHKDPILCYCCFTFGPMHGFA